MTHNVNLLSPQTKHTKAQLVEMVNMHRKNQHERELAVKEAWRKEGIAQEKYNTAMDALSLIPRWIRGLFGANDYLRKHLKG